MVSKFHTSYSDEELGISEPALLGTVGTIVTPEEKIAELIDRLDWALCLLEGGCSADPEEILELCRKGRITLGRVSLNSARVEKD